MSISKKLEKFVAHIGMDSTLFADELCAKTLRIRGWLKAIAVNPDSTNANLERIADEVKGLVEWASELQVSTVLNAERNEQTACDLIAEQQALDRDFMQRFAAAAAHDKSKPEVRQQVWAMTEGKCAYCEIDLDLSGTTATAFVVEHVVPVSSGGPDNIANYVPACVSCNASKRDGHVLTFIQRRFGREKKADLRVVQYVPTRME